MPGKGKTYLCYLFCSSDSLFFYFQQHFRTTGTKNDSRLPVRPPEIFFQQSIGLFRILVSFFPGAGFYEIHTLFAVRLFWDIFSFEFTGQFFSLLAKKD